MSVRTLPSFNNPPVVETVLGFQFDPIDGLTNAMLGVFWSRLRDESTLWERAIDAPSLEPVFEEFGDERAWPPARLLLRLSKASGARIRITNAAGDRMVQLQNGRFHYNWLGQAGGPYPHYEVIRPEFDKLHAFFQRFLADEGLAKLKPNQWEVTYLNHIQKGTVWTSPGDWSLLFRALPAPSAAAPSAILESFGGEWHFEIPPKRGRLHVKMNHGRKGKEDADEVLVLNLTARGPLSGDASLADGLDVGRKSIVQAFANLTSEAAHKHWGIHNGNA